MNDDNKKQNRRVSWRVALLVAWYGILYLINLKLFLVFLGLYLIIFIVSHIGLAVVKRGRAAEDTDEAPEDLSARIYTAHDSFGPRTDTKNMNRSELFRSGMQFLLLSTLPFFTIFGVMVVNASFEVIPEPTALVIMFASAIFLLMCLVGGAYLMLLSLFRRPLKSSDLENESVEMPS